MASLVFLIIHPIWYPIYCGGKGKAMKLIGKGKEGFLFAVVSCDLPVTSCRLPAI